MPCYRPLKGYRARAPHPVTKRCGITFNAHEGYYDQPVNLPCGQCIGCRLERSRQWAIRCVHEAAVYERNCFLTLTYAEEFLPVSRKLGLPFLKMKDFQDFMKRLRFKADEPRRKANLLLPRGQKVPFDDKDAVRFFHCGEYGEKHGRPHYHACVFNWDFGDKYVWYPDRATEQRCREQEIKMYRSKALDELWPFGTATIGDVTFESAAYVARYITKKVLNENGYTDADGKYWPSEYETYQGRQAEYVTMSRRPGIGTAWFNLYSSDVFPSDRVVLRGREMRPPKFYDKLFEKINPVPDHFEVAPYTKVGMLKAKRTVQGKIISQAEPESRLSVREECHLLRFQQLKRGFENV